MAKGRYESFERCVMSYSQENNEILKAGGRPTQGKNSPRITTVMPEWMLEKLNKYAKERKIARGEAIRQILNGVL